MEVATSGVLVPAATMVRAISVDHEQRERGHEQGSFDHAEAPVQDQEPEHQRGRDHHQDVPEHQSLRDRERAEQRAQPEDEEHVEDVRSHIE